LKTLNFDYRKLLDITNFVNSKKSLMVGGRFFLLQLSSLLLFSLGNILTYNYLQLKDVSQFDTINKLFMMGTILFNVLISIFWAEISEAKAATDQVKLLKMYKQLLYISFCVFFLTVGVSFFLPFFIHYWTKGVISASLVQLAPFVLLFAIQIFSYAGAVFLNAFEEIKGQIGFSIIAAVLIVPLSIFFFRNDIGIGSVPLAASIVCIPGLIYILIKSKSCIKNIGQL
jgi:O-antigen/teichoic acid export membrane protein